MFNSQNIVLTILFLLQSIILRARNDSIVQGLSVIPLPIISYAPETRFAFGAAGVANFYSQGDKPSSVFVASAYTQNQQALFYTQFQLFLKDGIYYLYGKAGYYIYSYYFFGIGEAEVPKELYSVNFPRAELNFTKKVLPNIYAGIGYQYEHYAITNTEANGTLAKGIIPGSKGSTTSGLGVQALYDTRDSVFYPSGGWFGTVSLMIYGNTFGGNYNFNRFIADITKYQQVHKHVILCVNSYNSFVSGVAPFEQLSLLGNNKEMRGYYKGRYSDNNLMVMEAECRYMIYQRFGGAVFFNSGALGNQKDFIRTNDIKYTYGVGLRYDLVRKSHLNIRFDYAMGPGTSGVYVTMGEAY